MESLLKCPSCIQDFNLNDNRPYILPCYNVICLKCIYLQSHFPGGYIIDCNCDNRNHKVLDLQELSSCEMILNVLNNSHEKTKAMENVQKQVINAQFGIIVAKKKFK